MGKNKALIKKIMQASKLVDSQNASKMGTALGASFHLASVIRESELDYMKETPPKIYPPRPAGSQTSYAFESEDEGGRKVTRYSDKPARKSGERRKRHD
jgi:hypothetical protein